MTRSKLLDTAAVSILAGDDAGEILHEYMNTSPEMVLSVHPSAAAVQQQPQGAGDKLKR